MSENPFGEIIGAFGEMDGEIGEIKLNFGEITHQISEISFATLLVIPASHAKSPCHVDSAKAFIIGIMIVCRMALLEEQLRGFKFAFAF